MAWVKKLPNLTTFLQQQPSCRLTLSAVCSRKKTRTIKIRERVVLSPEEREHKRNRILKHKASRKPHDDAVERVRVDFREELEERTRLLNAAEGEVKQLEKREREDKLYRLGLVAKSNEELAVKREEHIMKNAEEARVSMLEADEAAQNLRKELHEMNTKLVLRVIEESKNFVTLENIDEKIEQALTNDVTSHNFALTVDWKKIHSTKPPGNLEGWKGPPPTAYIAGGIEYGSDEWNEAFGDFDPGFNEQSIGLRSQGIFPVIKYRR